MMRKAAVTPMAAISHQGCPLGASLMSPLTASDFA